MAQYPVRFHDWLFDESLYKQEVQRFTIPPAVQRRARTALDRFQRAWGQRRFVQAGRGIPITELKAQQAFNQVIFCELLGFDDMLTGQGTYALLPEVSFTLKLADDRTVRPRADVAFGVFAVDRGEVGAVAEHKSPQVPLDKSQRGIAYKSAVSGKQLSPIDQALEAMASAKCEWALVSNIKELCLVHASAPDHALRFDLSALAEQEIRDFYFAFGPGGFLEVDQKRSRLKWVYERAKKLAKT